MSISNLSDEVKFAVMQNDLTYIKEKLNAVDMKVSSSYVTKEEFEPIKRVVYGMVTVILVSVVAATLTLVIK